MFRLRPISAIIHHEALDNFFFQLCYHSAVMKAILMEYYLSLYVFEVIYILFFLHLGIVNCEKLIINLVQLLVCCLKESSYIIKIGLIK